MGRNDPDPWMRMAAALSEEERLRVLSVLCEALQVMVEAEGLLSDLLPYNTRRLYTKIHARILPMIQQLRAQGARRPAPLPCPRVPRPPPTAKALTGDDPAAARRYLLHAVSTLCTLLQEKLTAAYPSLRNNVEIWRAFVLGQTPSAHRPRRLLEQARQVLSAAQTHPLALRKAHIPKATVTRLARLVDQLTALKP